MQPITRDLKIKHPLFSSFQNLLSAAHQTPTMRCWRRSRDQSTLSQPPGVTTAYFLDLLFPRISQATARHLAFSLLENWNRINILLNFERRISCSPKAKCLSLLLRPKEHLLEQDYTTLFKRDMLIVKKKQENKLLFRS